MTRGNNNNNINTTAATSSTKTCTDSFVGENSNWEETVDKNRDHSLQQEDSANTKNSQDTQNS